MPHVLPIIAAATAVGSAVTQSQAAGSAKRAQARSTADGERAQKRATRVMPNTTALMASNASIAGTPLSTILSRSQGGAPLGGNSLLGG